MFRCSCSRSGVRRDGLAAAAGEGELRGTLLHVVDDGELFPIPSDARVNPTDAVMAFAAAARARGVAIYQDVPVSEIFLRDGVVQGVATANGMISCDTVVVAAGLWSGDLVKSCADDACPEEAIVMSPNVEIAALSRKGTLWHKSDLLVPVAHLEKRLHHMRRGYDR